MHIEFTRDKARVFPTVTAPLEVSSARVWHCKYDTLAPLSQFKNVQSLVIATYPDQTLELLNGLTQLEALQILHMPGVTSLEPLSQLRRLRRLSLGTLPSWDAAGKLTLVDSLAPLATLPVLEELELYGVVPRSRLADDLYRCPSLTRVRLSKYPQSEQQKVRERFAA
jgi:hypothetical protein